MSEKNKAYYFKQPRFYSSFHCTGEKCLVNCCFNWATIGWTEKEYQKLICSEMSQKFKEKIDKAFVASSDKKTNEIFPYIIKYNQHGQCPMLTNEGLCSIQKELGEDYLSHTCRAYPRIILYGGTAQNVRTCFISCTHVMEILCSEDDSMELVETSVHSVERAKHASNINNKIFDKYPQVKHTDKLFDFFYELLSDKSHSIETSMILGAMAAQKLDELIAKGQAEKIPEILNALKPQIDNPSQIEKLENVKPNLSLKANFVAAILQSYKEFNTLDKYVFENNKPSEEKWQKGTEEFNKRYKPFALRNVALNIYISGAMPFHDLSFSLYDNFRYYVSEYALIKYLAVTCSLKFESEMKSFEIAAAYADRGFTHVKEAINRNLAIMDKYNITSPAYLMGILK